MKKIIIILITIPFIGYAQINIVSEIANENLLNWLEKIPTGEELNFGFNDRDNFKIAEIGTPYEIFTLNSDFFTDGIINTEKQYIESTKIWRVPIVVNNQYKALLTVSNINNKWEVVKIGAKGLANELKEFENNNPTVNESNILRIFQIKSDFILTSENKIHPLSSAVNSLLIDKRKIYSLNYILSLIKKREIEE